MATWEYTGDLNLEYGGAYFDLSTWHDGYIDCVRISDLDNGCGFRGAVMVERVTINLKREEYKNALKVYGMEFKDVLRIPGHAAKKFLLAEALLSYGVYESDHYQVIIQCDEYGEASFDGWQAEVFLHEHGQTLEEYVHEHWLS